MIPRDPHPRPRCWRCEDWKTVLGPDGKGTRPCPNCQKSKKNSPNSPNSPRSRRS